MERGELVSDAIVSALIGERLDAAHGKGAIFDGFPRTSARPKRSTCCSPSAAAASTM